MDYTVTIEVQVTADSPEQAAQFAIDDLRDQSLGPWNADVSCSRGKQTVQSAGSPAMVDKLFIEKLGYGIDTDSEQSGLWIWTAPTSGCKSSFHTAQDALNSAWLDAVGQTMGHFNISSEDWDALGFDKQGEVVSEAFSEMYGFDEVQQVVNEFLSRAKDNAFKSDEDVVRLAVEEYAYLLGHEFSEEQIVQACERIMHSDEAVSERQRG